MRIVSKFSFNFSMHIDPPKLVFKTISISFDLFEMLFIQILFGFDVGGDVGF